MSSYPKWHQTSFSTNLREVAPRLYVGAQTAVRVPVPWSLVVDLVGTTKSSDVPHGKLLQAKMYDGARIERRVLDRVAELVAEYRQRGPILIHCHAGLSRSVSVAYAMLRVLYGLSHKDALRRVKAHQDYPRQATLQSAVDWVSSKKME